MIQLIVILGFTRLLVFALKPLKQVGASAHARMGRPADARDRGCLPSRR